MATRIWAFMTFLPFFGLALCQWKCSTQVYGRPALADCANALLALPEGSSRTPSEKLMTLRPFVEPQFLEPPFGRVENTLGAPMEQLPKFWKYRSCRIALMATADRAGQVIDASPLSTWAFIEHEALKVTRNCLGMKKGGGFVLVADPVGDGALSVYVYAVGSPFELILNNYMITSQALHPPNSGVGLNGSSLTWAFVNGTPEAIPAKTMRLLQALQ